MLAPLLLTLAAAVAPDAERVTFSAADGLTIVAEYHAPRGDGPTVICLPMFRSTRESFEPLTSVLRQAGLGVLALDLRGHGESAPELGDRVAGRDSEVFGAMHQDVTGAIEFLRGRGADTTRLALVGASVGCSVAVDATVRAPSDVRAVVLLTPGASYLGVDTLAHLEQWPSTPALVLTSSEERENVAPVSDALLERSPDTTRLEVIEGSGIHGTRMFGAVEGLERRILAFLREELEPPHLLVPRFAADDERVATAGFVRHTLRTTRRVAGEEGGAFTLMAFAVGDVLTLGAMVRQPFHGNVELKVGERTLHYRWNSEATAPFRVETGDDLEVQAAPGRVKNIAWTTIELDLATALPAGRGTLALTFDPEGDAPKVHLPGGKKPFRVELVGR